MKLGDRLIRRALGMRGQVKQADYRFDTMGNVLWPCATNIGSLIGAIAGEPDRKWLSEQDKESFMHRLLGLLPGVGAYRNQRRSAYANSDAAKADMKDADKLRGLRNLLAGGVEDAKGATKTASAQDIGAGMGRMLDAASRRQQELSRAVDGPISRYVRGAALRHPGATMEGAKAGAQLGAVASDVAPGAALGGVGAMLLAAALGSENWGKWGLAGALAGGAANGAYNAMA